MDPKRRLPDALLAASALLAALLLAEAALRLGGFSWPVFYTVDDRIGPVLRPGAEGRFSAEGGARVRISAQGLRDREHDERKPPGVFRIAVLGDSYAEAMQLPAEDAFWSILERSLSGDPAVGGRPVEAINFGVSGYGTAQELLTLRHRALRFAPDLVILAVTTGNDVRNNSRALEGDPSIPYFRLRDGVLVPDERFRESPRYREPWRSAFAALAFLSDHSRLVQLANRVKNVVLARRAAGRQAEAAARIVRPLPSPAASPAAPPDRPTPPPPAGDWGIDASVFRPPVAPEWEEAWRVTEALVARAAREAREGGARFLVVALTSGIQVHPDPAVRRAEAERLGVADLHYPDRRLAESCRREGIPFLALAPELAAVATARKTFLHGFGNGLGSGHWNAEGHRIAGERIARAIRDAAPARRAPGGEGAGR